MDETEWRTSFSLAENKLGMSVSPVQRHVMLLLKTLKNFHFPDVISTYYLKNLLFLACEGKDEFFWNESNSGRCVLYMLYRLQVCLEAHDLPHYFIPQSNLLLCEDHAKLDEAAAVVSELRRGIHRIHKWRPDMTTRRFRIHTPYFRRRKGEIGRSTCGKLHSWFFFKWEKVIGIKK